MAFKHAIANPAIGVVRDAPRLSLLPFLYHTRTLKNVRSSKQHTAGQPSWPGHTRRSSFHHTAQNAVDEITEMLGGVVRRVKNDSPIFRKVNSDDQTVGFHRVGLNKRFLKITADADSRNEKNDARLGSQQYENIGARQEMAEDVDDMERYRSASETQDIDEQFEDFFNGEAAAVEPRNFSKAPSQRESTITVSERQAFDRIFAELASAQGSLADPFPDEPENGSSPSKLRSKESKTSLTNIIEAALSQASSKGSGEDAAAGLQKNLKIAVDRYPKPLREAAARASAVLAERATIKAYETAEQAAMEQAAMDGLDGLRQPERTRVENMMRSAKTDFDLWDVMECQVFPLVRQLRLDDKTAKKTKKQSKQGSYVIPGLEPVSADAKDVQIPPLTLFGPLYPSYLLLGLRLLDRAFAKPSPLVRSVLPRIKELGTISHVLGASTAFYNELIRIYYTRFSDFRGAQDLLAEMRQSGLEFDVETLEIVDHMYQTQLQTRQGINGKGLQALWRLPEFAPKGFKTWRSTIENAIAEKSREREASLAWEKKNAESTD